MRTPSARPGLKAETVLEEPVIAALPDEHPLAARPRLTLPDLEGQPLVLLSRSGAPGLRDALQAAIAALGGEDVITQEVAEMQTVTALVAAGAGVSLVPESVHLLAREGVTYRELDGEAPTVRLEMTWRASEDSPVLAAFLAMARAMAPAEGERGRQGPQALR
jgi:DNA-binding transcriptional LysR family regulator